MKPFPLFLVLPALFLSLFAFDHLSWAASFELNQGDRVVFLGDALIEQEQYAGWIELMLTTSHANRDVTFRNLGWSADTPSGDSRFGLSLLQAGYEPDDEGWKQLIKQIELTKPTVVFLGYGMASSLEGGLKGVDTFSRDYQRLIDAIKKVTPQVRFVFLSPINHIDQSDRQQTLSAYFQAVRRIAELNGQTFVDLSAVAANMSQRKDPIHLNDAGYRDAAIAIQQQLGMKSDWSTSPYSEALRTVILRKNVWWFHRSRPANMAYVFGFRKREQGQNAVEIPKFDDLVADEEQAIASLRRLQPVELQPKKPQIDSKYAKFIQQPTPEFTVGKDLEVTLWAENPQLNKPIHMNFDPSGRLWVASSEAYPMIEVGQSAPDKILVLEDSDGDGKADKSTVFADGLLIPTGVVPGNGGCYVAQSTDLLFLKDIDGDGKADVRQRVLSGFGTEDTHHNLHTLCWGPDGRLYMNQSIYTRTDAETPRGVVRLKGGGGFRYNPESMRMQVVFRGLVNSWGHQFDAYGQSFLTDGAGGAGVAYSFPGAAFSPAPKTRRVMDLISPGNYPKFASAEILYGDSFPPDWQGSVITCDFRANRVTRFSMTDQAAGFVTQQEDDLLRTSESSFRPIDVKQGPDGAIYIADWSNPIINHGEVDFRDERRDRWHGRIWRVAWKGAKTKKHEDLAKLDNDELFARLVSKDRYTRDQSRRVLLERKDQIVGSLTKWTEGTKDEFGRLQAVWLQQGVGTVNPVHLSSLAASRDPQVRSAAMRIAADLADPESDTVKPLAIEDAMALFQNAIRDAHPRVRLEAIRGLGKIKTAEAARVALESLNHPRDRFLDFALATTMDELTLPFMKALENQQWKPESPERERQLEFVLTNIEPVFATTYLSKYLAANAISKEGTGPWIELIGKAGGQEELSKLLEQTVSNGFNSAATTRALQALGDAQRLRRQKPKGDLNVIRRLIDSSDESIRTSAIRLVGSWRLSDQMDLLTTYATISNSEGVRSTSIAALREIGNPAVDALTKLANSNELATRKPAVIALAALGPTRAVKLFYSTLARIENEQEAIGLWRGFLATKDAGKALTENFPKDGVSQIVARAGITAAKDGGRNEPALIAALTPFADVAMKAEKLTTKRIAELVSLVASKGNPEKGEIIYSRPELACIQCHAIGGVGGKVGPDMTSLGASAPIDYLIESIYDPNAKIKENYHSVIVATDDGQVVTGIQVESNKEELVIRDGNNKIIRVPLDNIAGKKAGQSLMPQGVVDRLTQSEQVDLIAFLSQLGKPGRFDSSQGGVARVFELLPGDHRIEQRGADRIISGEVKEGWKPLWARIDGTVSRDQIDALTQLPRNISLVNVYLKTHVSLARDGQVTLSIPGVDTAALWVDGIQVNGKSAFVTQLTAGKHVVLLRLDARSLPATFRLESRDVTFATE
jgi:putative heme-binding domain-containing protein